MSEHDRAIYAFFKSPRATLIASELWDHAQIQCPHWSPRQRLAHLLPILAEHALTEVLAPDRREEREACAREIEARAIWLRDHGPTSREGLLTATAGAQVGALFDAAASLRNVIVS